MAENTEGRDFAVEGNDTSAYIGVSPEYQTYANETEAPLTVERKSEKAIAERVAEHEELVAGEPQPAVVEAEAEERKESAEDSEAAAKAAAEAAAEEKKQAEKQAADAKAAAEKKQAEQKQAEQKQPEQK